MLRYVCSVANRQSQFKQTKQAALYDEDVFSIITSKCTKVKGISPAGQWCTTDLARPCPSDLSKRAKLRLRLSL